MLRLSVLLCACLFVALLIAGEDRGQMRPGLAEAVAEGRDIVVLARAPSSPVPRPAAPKADKTAAAALPPAKLPPAKLPVVEAAFSPAALPRDATPAPVFTLSALPTLGGDAAALPEPAETDGGGQVWYVNATAINVRQDPSTTGAIVDQLAGGEAVTVIGAVDADWVQVLVEGDGVSGFVARRFLAPTAP